MAVLRHYAAKSTVEFDRIAKTTLFGRYYKQPYFRCALTVRGVIRTEPDLAALDEPVSFDHPEVSDDGRSIDFASNTGSAFTVFVSRLDVELRVTDEIATTAGTAMAEGRSAGRAGVASSIECARG